MYEEAEETIDSDDQSQQVETFVADAHEVTHDNEEEVKEKKVFEQEKKPAVEIKKEDETAECDICNKVFRTTAVIR